MHCLILFRDSAGRLPTAQELRGCGFEVSAAALPPVGSPILHAHTPAKPPALALAAEPASTYGNGRNSATRHTPSMPEQTPVVETVAEAVAETVAEAVASNASA